jgi:hypothetical protein
MTLGDLTTQFMGLLNNNVVNKNAALVSTFINQAIMRIQRELRVPFMEKQILYTIPTDGSYTKLAIPSDLLELIAIMVDADRDGILEYELRRTELMKVVRMSELPNYPPQIYARQGGSWILGPSPAPGSQVLIYYYAEFAPVVNATDTNTCLTVAWDAVLYGALSAACDYLVDDRASTFEGRYTQITQQLQNQADADELTGDAVVAPALRLDTDDCGW